MLQVDVMTVAYINRNIFLRTMSSLLYRAEFGIICIIIKKCDEGILYNFKGATNATCNESAYFLLVPNLHFFANQQC